MEVVNGAINVIKIGVSAYGGWVAFQGIVQWGAAHREHNGAEKSKATDAIIGGAVIIIAAIKLIPLIQTAIS